MEERGFCPSDSNFTVSCSLGHQPVALLCRSELRIHNGMSQFLKINIFSLSLSLSLSCSFSIDICIHTHAHIDTYTLLACFFGNLYHHHPPNTHCEVLRWLSGKESACQCRICRFYPWVKKITLRREGPPTPIFLPEKSHDRGAWWLTVISPRGCKVSDVTELLNNNNSIPQNRLFH